MINYSIAIRAVNSNLLEINQAKARIKAAKEAGVEPNPADVELANTPAITKAYAVAQYADIMTIEKFAKHISEHGCVYSRADISAILYMAVDCMREQLLDGKKIRLGDLGDFSVSIVSKGADSAEKFNAGAHITGINVTWDCGQQFKNLLADAEFNLVASRSAQAAILKAIKAGSTTVNLAGSNDNADDNDNPDPNGGGSGSGSGSNSGTSGTGSGSGTNSSNGSNTSSPSNPIGETVKFSTYKNPSLGGTVTAGGTYAKGTEVTIEATPAEGYLFDMWSDHVTDNPRTITLTANKSVTAWFYKPGEQKPSEMEDEETQL